MLKSFSLNTCVGKKLQYNQHATVFYQGNLPILQSNSKRSLQVLLYGNHFHHKMNFNYVQGIVLIVLACVLHTNCKNLEKTLTKSDKFLEENPSKSSHKRDEKLLNDKKKNAEVEDMLLKIATIIQDCIDKRTMNNKKFKIKLDDLYNDLVKPKITKAIKNQLIKVKDIKKQYEEDVEVLKIMNSMPDSDSSKNKDKSSKKKSKKHHERNEV